MASKAERLKAQLAVLEAEEAFVKAKAAGQAKRDKAIAKAFDAAKTPEAYAAAVAKIAPAVSAEVKDELRTLRADYRANHRGAPKDGGAAPDTHNAGSQVN